MSCIETLKRDRQQASIASALGATPPIILPKYCASAMRLTIRQYKYGFPANPFPSHLLRPLAIRNGSLALTTINSKGQSRIAYSILDMAGR
jgi:hypothetical protein